MLSIPHKAHQSSRRHKERVVSKPQRILIVSDCEHAVSELPVREADNYLFSYCAGDGRDSEFIKSGRPFDWLLLDGNLLHGDQMDLMRSLRTIGFFYAGTGIQGISGASSSGLTREFWNCIAVCGRVCENSVARQSGEDQDSCVFEFHGPMSRTG